MASQTSSQCRRQLHLRSDLAELAQLAGFIDEICAAEALDADRRFAIELSLEEAITNIIMHGGIDDKAAPHISLRLTAGAPSLTFCLEDDAQPFDPTAVPPPVTAASLEEAQIGGAGLPLIRKLTSGLRYEHADGRNRLFLSFGPRSRA